MFLKAWVKAQYDLIQEKRRNLKPFTLEDFLNSSLVKNSSNQEPVGYMFEEYDWQRIIKNKHKI